ncbi:MAG: DUF2188 domain-containing protein [Ignavibacteriae bacterium]|nr:MAG: DUF2188 domain-containing protein [Ignavibacteriota bacterium]
MAKRKNQHIVPLGNGWGVKSEGSSKFTIITSTKNQAISAGKLLAKSQKSELVIHGKDGKIMDKDSYSKDKCPPKDKKH